MGKNTKRKRGRGNSLKDSFLYQDQDFSREKQKARELRQSPWWKKKISEGLCYYCGKSFKPDELTMDHKIPLVRGGVSEKNNLVPACKDCNNKKKYMLPTEWDEYMNRLKGE